ncbi:MAG: hypothetical protein IKN55_10955 [Oscillospiraceae bacterium]|nr:hypothetical protein [Oscillospiraceae bacterium]
MEIRQKTGKTPEDIIKMLFQYIVDYTDIPVTEELMDSYRRMNVALKSMLNEN